MKYIFTYTFLGAFLTLSNIEGYYGQNNPPIVIKSSSQIISEMQAQTYSKLPDLQNQNSIIYHNDGSKSVMNSGSYGGIIHHSNGTKTSWINR